MGVPRVYRKSGEQIIASYSFTDLIEGLGLITLYGIQSSVGYKLINYQEYSKGKQIIINSLDMDADTGEFNTQQTVSGTAFISVGMAATAGNAFSLTYQIFKVSGAVETAMTSVITGKTQASGTAGMDFVELPLTETILKKGDKIRCNIKVNAGVNSYFGFNSKELWDGGLGIGAPPTTEFTLYLPIKINL